MTPGSRRRLAALALLAGLVVAAACRPRSQPPIATTAEPPPSAAPAASGKPATVVVKLYFPGEERLFPEARELALASDPLAQARLIVEALLAGPQSAGLVPPLPQGTTLGGVYQITAGELIVDFINPAGPPASAGSLREMLATYSVVSSLVLNLDGVERALILWNDRQQPSMAGHLDTSRPLPVDTRLIARTP